MGVIYRVYGQNDDLAARYTDKTSTSPLNLRILLFSIPFWQVIGFCNKNSEGALRRSSAHGFRGME